MRTISLTAALVLAAAGLAADKPADKPAKWEYAELSFRNAPVRVRGTDADGKEVAPAPPATPVRWTTGKEEVLVKGWDELAEKLKVPFKKDGSASFQKMQVLNALGAEGWELVEQSGTTVLQPAGGLGGAGGPGGFGPGGLGGGGPGGRAALAPTSTLMFKRRVP